METGRTSNRIMNTPQEMSTNSRMGKHRTMGSPNGCLPLLVALAQLFVSDMLLTMVDTSPSMYRGLLKGRSEWRKFPSPTCLRHATPSIEHWGHRNEKGDVEIPNDDSVSKMCRSDIWCQMIVATPALGRKKFDELSSDVPDRLQLCISLF